MSSQGPGSDWFASQEVNDQQFILSPLEKNL